MKPNKKMVLFSGTLFIACASFASIRIKSVIVPAVRIVVVDAETREPVPNIAVYYYVESGYWKSFLGIPQFIEPYSRNLLLKKYVTNERGEVSVPAQRVWIKLLYEDVGSVDFYVNFDMEFGKCSKKERIRLFDRKIKDLICYEDEDGVVLDKAYKVTTMGFVFKEKEAAKDKGKVLKEEKDANIWYRKYINYGSLREKDKGTFVVELFVRRGHQKGESRNLVIEKNSLTNSPPRGAEGGGGSESSNP